MKTHKNLWPAVTSFQNLLLAARRAQRGKRFRRSTAEFNFNLESELLLLRRELLDRTYEPGPYRTFYIHEPKKRLISAAPYRDRVVHHAVCNVIEPLFERGFIDDSYACRVGKGTHAAVDRFQGYLRRLSFVLKCDVRKFFPSIDHEILKERIRRRIADPDVLWLIDLILDNSNLQEPMNAYFAGDDLWTPFERRRGLPIGNLTSQFFANVYLDGFDHFVRQVLRPGGYVRYCDDFVLFSNDKAELWGSLAAIREKLAELRLLLHPKKCQVFPAGQGAPFLGYHVYPDRRRLDPKNGWKMVRRLRRMERAFARGEIGVDDVRASVHAWIGHAVHAETVCLRRRILGGAAFVKGRPPIRLVPCGAGRVLEQQPEQPAFGEPQQQHAGQPQQQHRRAGGVVGFSTLGCLNPAVPVTAGACVERVQVDVLCRVHCERAE